MFHHPVVTTEVLSQWFAEFPFMFAKLNFRSPTARSSSPTVWVRQIKIIVRHSKFAKLFAKILFHSKRFDLKNTVRLWICLRFSITSFSRRREDIQNIGKISNFNINHMVIYIIRRAILRWLRIWSAQYIIASRYSNERWISSGSV